MLTRSLTKRLMRFALAYLFSIPLLGILGFVSDFLAYAFLVVSSALFAFGMIYETWKDSRRIIDIKFPSPERTPQLEELEALTVIVDKAISGHNRYNKLLTNRLKRIFLEKMKIRSGMTEAEVENLLESPEKLRTMVEDADLLELLSSSDDKNKDGRLAWLTRVLDKLEEWER